MKIRIFKAKLQMCIFLKITFAFYVVLNSLLTIWMCIWQDWRYK